MKYVVVIALVICVALAASVTIETCDQHTHIIGGSEICIACVPTIGSKLFGGTTSSTAFVPPLLFFTALVVLFAFALSFTSSPINLKDRINT